MVSFIKKGAEAAKIVTGERKKADAREAQYERDKKARQFFVKKGKHTEVTFVDGDLYEGILNNVFYMHAVTPEGGEKGKDTQNYVCIGEAEADEGKQCPICADGDVPKHMVALTVIDHTEYTDKEKVTHKDQKRLFLATNSTQKLLETEADVRKGLSGVKYRATRENKAFEPRVGGTYTYLTKATQEESIATFGEEKFTPLDYDDVLPIFPYEELIDLGFGASIMNVSKEAEKATEKVDVEKEL